MLNPFVRCCLMMALWLAISPFPKVIAQENVVIVLDDSGSMNERMGGGSTRMEAAKKAIASVIEKFPSDTQLGLFLLNGARKNDHWAIPLGHHSVSVAQRIVQSIRADGGTPLGDRIREGTDALLKQREKQIYGTYRLLIVTDGEANDAKLLAAYLPDVLSRGIIVDAIGVDMKTNHSLATRVHSYRRADDDAALSKAVQEVFAEKFDANASGDDQEYQLLEAIDSETAKEALQLLSKPNNGPIVGIKKPDTWTAPTTTSTGGVGILRAIVVTLFSCMIPVFLFVSTIFIVLAKARRR